jgi:hypothetical protein
MVGRDLIYLSKAAQLVQIGPPPIGPVLRQPEMHVAINGVTRY